MTDKKSAEELSGDDLDKVAGGGLQHTDLKASKFDPEADANGVRKLRPERLDVRKKGSK